MVCVLSYLWATSCQYGVACEKFDPFAAPLYPVLPKQERQVSKGQLGILRHGPTSFVRSAVCVFAGVVCVIGRDETTAVVS